MRNFHRFDIPTAGRTSGKLKTYCPQCRDQRKNKRDKPLSVNLDTGFCYCYHCGWNCFVPDESELRELQERNRNRLSKGTLPQHFHRPEFNPSHLHLSEAMERWLVETRCIPQKVIETLRLSEEVQLMPQSGENENCVCFNYFENGKLVNVKYRSAKKHFKMVSGAELIPYNIDAILSTPECIFTEGELDAASFLAIGRTDAISVPSGANANLNWLDRFVETHFEGKKLIYIAVDTDTAGLKLRGELVRRLGSERCRIVTYGPGCKDANEHLVKYGADSLRVALEQAEEVPLEGVFTADNLADELRALYENGFGAGAATGWDNFDAICTLELQRLMVVTGVPGSGKSEWVDELVLRLCLRHDWKIGFFSPENIPIVYHLRKLSEKLTACRFQPGMGMTDELYARVIGYLTNHVCHILPKENFTLENILVKGRELVARRGIRILVIDPLNRLEHTIPPGQTETQYLSSLLNSLSAFAVRHHCLVVLVAHPRKMNRSPLTGKIPCPDMYDINGSADFYNKADFGVVVERDDPVRMVRVHVEKVKFKHLGQKGDVCFVYDLVSGRYYPCEEDMHSETLPEQKARNTKFDTGSWLNDEAEAVQGELWIPPAEGA